ncbi:hypothetical protein [Micromonospora tulbaghiae]
MGEPELRSGRLADAAGVDVQTLRYDERRGLPAAQRLGFALAPRSPTGCDDLVTCAASSRCPLPFAGPDHGPATV